MKLFAAFGFSCLVFSLNNVCAFDENEYDYNVVQDITKDEESAVEADFGPEVLIGIARNSLKTGLSREQDKAQSSNYNTTCVFFGFGAGGINDQRLYYSFDCSTVLGKSNKAKDLNAVYSAYYNDLEKEPAGGGTLKEEATKESIKNPYQVRIYESASPIFHLKLGYSPYGWNSVFFIRLGAVLSKYTFQMYGTSTINNNTTKDMCNENITQLAPSVGVGIEKKLTSHISLQFNAIFNLNRKKIVKDILAQEHKISTRKAIFVINLRIK